jgi:hypothetical protein
MNKLVLKKMLSIKECYLIIFDLHKKFHKDNQRNLNTELFISCFDFEKVLEKGKSNKINNFKMGTTPSGMKVELVAYWKDQKELDWLMANV